MMGSAHLVPLFVNLLFAAFFVLGTQANKQSWILNRIKRAPVQDTSKNSLTQAERDEFLSKHNEYRGQVSPTATNMRQMVWHSELESMAQEFANGCVYGHGNPTRDPPPFTNIGQNIWAGTGGYDTTGSVTAWYNEVSDYTYSSNSCASGKVCGHYTQVVWDNSYALGCGIAYCSSIATLGAGYFIVCNYGPAGNWQGEKPFDSGTSCSACPTGFTCSGNLCTNTTSTGTGSNPNGPDVSGSRADYPSSNLFLVFLLSLLIFTFCQ